jgi:choline-phosphate cytidylyltransferase
MFNIYVDGIYDLFHAGHVTTLKYIKNMSSDVNLIVGIVNDKDATNYKRVPVINEDNRYIMLYSCKYVDNIITNAPLIITKEFMLENNIDLVVHGFNNPEDEDSQSEFFKVPIEMGKYKTIPYSYIESTSNIIKRIKDQY